MKRKYSTCDTCNKSGFASDNFVYEDKVYCYRCTFELIYAIAGNGEINIDVTDDGHFITGG